MTGQQRHSPDSTVSCSPPAVEAPAGASPRLTNSRIAENGASRPLRRGAQFAQFSAQRSKRQTTAPKRYAQAGATTLSGPFGHIQSVTHSKLAQAGVEVTDSGQWPWADIPKRLQSVILGMLKIVAAGMLAFGISLAWLTIPLHRGEAWASWAILSVICVNGLISIYVTVSLRRVAPAAKTNITTAFSGLALVLLAVVMANLK
jgi:hypothetical protein